MRWLRSIVLLQLILLYGSWGRPPLVVILVIDQMRGDYLQRWEYVWTGGMRRLLTQGQVFTQCFYEHANNMTGPGHATLATGTYPAKHSIVTNTFYDRYTRQYFYCVEDSLARLRGEFLISPSFLKVPTFGDWVKEMLPQARVVSIAHKDRAAVTMGGKSADLVLWFDRKAWQWGNSPAYGDTLPQWVQDWNRQYPIARWQHWKWEPQATSTMYWLADSVQWEGRFPGGQCFFPHTIPSVEDSVNFLKAYLCTPPAIEDVLTLARAVIVNEALGQDTVTDVLWIGISATDYLGHRFGPDSWEVAELFFELDKQLERFFQFLDTTVQQYLVVMSSDHGICPVQEYLQLMDLDAGRLNEDSIIVSLDQYLRHTFGGTADSWIEAFVPPSLFLNLKVVEALSLEWQTVVDSVVRWLSWYKGIGVAIAREELEDPQSTIPEQPRRWLLNDLYPGRSGDILIQPQPFWIFGQKVASHGYWYEYDRHVPLVFYGAAIVGGHDRRRCEPVDMVPTLLQLLNLPIPGWLDGTVLPLQKKR